MYLCTWMDTLAITVCAVQFLMSLHMSPTRMKRNNDDNTIAYVRN